VPGIGDILAYIIAAELGEIIRFASPKKLCGQPPTRTLVTASILRTSQSQSASSSALARMTFLSFHPAQDPDSRRS
jgi:hypothetical protein